MVVTNARLDPIAGIVLAGGKGRRIGGNKPFRPLGGTPLVARAIDRAAGQAAPLAVSANDGAERYREFGLPVLPDTVPGFVGPLAGILAGMEWAASVGIADLASFAGDAPFFPRDLVARLVAARRDEGADIACARSSGRLHPVFALWPVSLRAALRQALTEEGIRKVAAWSVRFRVAAVDFPALPFDPFFNINTPGDVTEAEALLAEGASVDNGSHDRMGKS